MKKIRVTLIGLIFILGFVQTVTAGEKIITLQSGMQIALEPNSRLSSVYIGLLIDRSAYTYSMDSLLYFEAVAQRIQQIISEIIPNTILYLPESFSEHPYNWLEQSYIYASLSADLFYTKREQIVQMFADLDKGLNFPYSNISIPVNRILVGNSVKSDQSITISRSDMEQFINKKNPYRLIRVYFYGNFDPLVVLRGLGKNTPAQVNLNYNKAPSGYIVFKASVKCRANEIKIKLPATTVEQYLALGYLADSVLRYVSKQKFGDKVNLEIRLPWSLHQQTCSVRLPYALDWQVLGSMFAETDPQDIRFWYYTRYSDKINLIAVDPESYVFYKLLSALYFDDAERLFRLWLPETFPSNRIADMIKKIGATIQNEEKPE